jgi:hypothetical protein
LAGSGLTIAKGLGTKNRAGRSIEAPATFGTGLIIGVFGLASQLVAAIMAAALQGVAIVVQQARDEMRSLARCAL